ncbi:hypothetical protein GGR54DRAFT_653579 [Hypoxylon sp. NC1633]|nr:hypothetical protein GGR54DRAFT_653579 [Hypoxylon sp. NC1633]
MAVESLGLAASVAGLVSLGLQITSGIVKYIDAFEGRQEELAFLKQHNDALSATLSAIDASPSSFHGIRPEYISAVTQNVQSCKEELGAAEELRVDLADRDRSTGSMRLENTKRKLTYAFHRSKIQQLAQRLQQANDVLQLTLTGLGLEISKVNAEKLIAIESSSQSHASELLLIRSEVAAVGTPIISIRDRLPPLQASIDNTTKMVVSQSAAVTHKIEESSQAVRQDIRLSHDSMELQFRQQQETLGRLEQLLRNLQLQDERGQSKGKLASRVASKPATLRELCDNMQAPNHEQSQEFPLNQISGLSQKRIVSPVEDLRFTGGVCICHRSHRFTTRRGFKLGYISVSSEQDSQGHWPNCPLSSKVASKKRRAISLKYAGLSRTLNSIIQLTFAWTSGAGGFGISPNFTYYPTVDVKSDPAFRIVGLVEGCNSSCRSDCRELFIQACLGALVKLFDRKDVCPTAVSKWDQSLMHYATEARNSTLCEWSYVRKIIQTLLSYGVPAFTYDTIGGSPLRLLGYCNLFAAQQVIEVLTQANLEIQPFTLDRDPEPCPSTTEAIALFDTSHSFAEACECGPLSMAVIRNDTNAVNRILLQFPSSLAEINIYGQSPLHLAATKPHILTILVAAADLSLLNQQDQASLTALDAAMMLSSTRCINQSHSICQQCACAQCIEILIDAGCDVRMHKGKYFRGLYATLSDASELARHRYILHMKEARLRRSPADKNLPNGSNTSQITARVQPSISKSAEEPQTCTGDDECWNWIYYEILPSLDFGELFYRYGFWPGQSFFIRPQWRPRLWCFLNGDYICWLVEHGVDLFLRSPAGPPMTGNSPNVGLFGAHYAFYFLGYSHGSFVGGTTASSGLLTAVERHYLTDSCVCRCSANGCSPFLWMIKGMVSRWSSNPDRYARCMSDYYGLCDPELALLTYKAAIRYMTFEIMGITHTCCNTESLAENGAEWVERDDRDLINEEQAPLLELHEELVAEFEEEALEFIEDESDDCPGFPEFWKSYWIERMMEVLEELDGDDLTDEERRGAEEIGVAWCEPVPVEEEVNQNPYDDKTLEFYFYELDLICPEYKEPWPEGLSRITELA